MKLRLLNASHSAFAYLGFLAGHEYIYQVAAQPDFVAFMRRLMEDEVTPTLVVPPDTDLAAYREALVTRFGNPALPHRTQQIAMDGSQKLPQRLLATTRENLAAGRSVRLASLAVAGWMRYVAGVDEKGNAIAVSDPFAKQFGEIAAAHRGDPAGLARSLLALRAVFGDDLPHDARFTTAVTDWLAALYADGAARTVARVGFRYQDDSMSTINLHPDRLFPADPATRDLARQLYATVKDLPIVSPHGHTDPQWFADDAPFPNASALFIVPDHYVFRMLYSQGVALEDLGVPRRDGGPVEADARKIWHRFAASYHLFRGTPTRIWLDHAFSTIFDLNERLSPSNADRFFDRINECLATPAFRPRALFERFNIEVIATTESPLDPLDHHREDPRFGMEGPRGHRVPSGSGRRPGLRRLRAKRRAVRRADRREHGDMEGLPRRASRAARVLHDDGCDVDRPRPSDGAHLRPRRG